ncbi:MAG: sfsA [Clostridiales bacterium]|jgi:sugar fermentation stimulation protein A|nr:sfsA [Clostridiales bacterium]
MLLKGEWKDGVFLSRPNRFEALVRIDSGVELVHVPNTGRMHELLHEGTEVILLKSNNPNRKTRYTLFFVKKYGHLICVNSVLANDVFEDGIKSGAINWLEGTVKREVTYHKSRIDFFIDGDKKTFIEIKCGTYEENGILMFPDAPTERGRKHIDELMDAMNEGYHAAIVVIAFMDYVEEFTPNYKIDRAFGEKLRSAFENGMIVKAYNCKIGLDEISIKDEIKIKY